MSLGTLPRTELAGEGVPRRRATRCIAGPDLAAAGLLQRGRHLSGGPEATADERGFELRRGYARGVPPAGREAASRRQG